jgi:hypothetical protein
MATAALVVIAVALGACGDDDKSSETKAPATSGKFGNAGGGGGPGASDTVGTGKIIADLGFRPDANSFKFENYGGGTGNKDMTAAEVRRIFGDQVCSSLHGNNCILTPPAQQWLEQSNQIMDGGHCYGFSVATLRLFKGEIKVSQFGADTITALEIANNEALQREIGYSFIFQTFDSVNNGVLKGTPNEMLDKMIEIFSKGKDERETYTIGFFKLEGGGGHAVTPYAVEDRGDGKFGVLIYDNNYPLVARDIIFDRNANTWIYNAATNPNEPSSEYKGNAESKSLQLMPTTPGTSQQPCPFCAGSGGGGSAAGLAAGPTYNEIYLDANPADHGHLVITDAQGRRTGYVNNKLVNDIPGAKVDQSFMNDDWRINDEPSYRIPTGIGFTVTIDGSPLKKADTENVVMIGPGYDIGIDSIELQPGQKDTITFSPDGRSITYKSSQTESPTIIVGLDGTDADYEFEVKSVKAPAGATITVNLDTAGKALSVNTSGAGTYAMALTRITSDDEQSFSHEKIALAADDVATLMYGNWKSNKSAIPLVVKHKGGTSDTIQLTDED